MLDQQPVPALRAERRTVTDIRPDNPVAAPKHRNRAAAKRGGA
jgi:hypothetical protein